MLLQNKYWMPFSKEKNSMRFKLFFKNHNWKQYLKIEKKVVALNFRYFSLLNFEKEKKKKKEKKKEMKLHYSKE